MDETRHIRGLFDRHHLVLFRVLRRLTGDADLAEDLVQETFVRALQAAGNYEERGAERAWLLTIARRLLADRRRAAARTPRLDPLADDDGSGPELPLRQHPDLRLALKRALAGLGSEEREAFVLREVGGLSHEEIARVTGTTRAAARNRIHRARLALRAALSGRKGRPHATNAAGDRT